MKPLIDLENVCKRFGGVTALDSVSMQLHAGQVHCLAGENGSGKSTLIKVLAGVHRPNEGTIAFKGQEIERLNPIESVRLGIQVIYQDFSLFPNFTVAENLSLNSQLEHKVRLVNRRRMWQIARQAMQRLGVVLPLEKLAGQLPTSQKQLVAIARALLQDARLIILDEPTTALTHMEVERLFQIIRSLTQRGVAILFVSHKLREMQEISDHFTVLRNGCVVADGSAGEFGLSRISQCMTGRVIPTQNHDRTQPQDSQPVLAAKRIKGSVVRDVTFQLSAGHIVGLTGLLGSGQSELALALFGLQNCESGEITIEGFPRPIRNVQDAIEAGIAYVPEDRLTEGLFLDQSIESNLISAGVEPVQASAGLLSPRRIVQHSREWLQEMDVQVSDSLAAARTLSGGNQQRIVLAKWLSRKPRVLILNGPTVGVDIGSKEKLHKKLRQLAADGMAVLMISDDLPELAENCHRVLVIHRGELVHEFSAEDLSEEAIAEYLSGLQ